MERKNGTARIFNGGWMERKVRASDFKGRKRERQNRTGGLRVQGRKGRAEQVSER